MVIRLIRAVIILLALLAVSAVSFTMVSERADINKIDAYETRHTLITALHNFQMGSEALSRLSRSWVIVTTTQYEYYREELEVTDSIGHAMRTFHTYAPPAIICLLDDLVAWSDELRRIEALAFAAMYVGDTERAFNYVYSLEYTEIGMELTLSLNRLRYALINYTQQLSNSATTNERLFSRLSDATWILFAVISIVSVLLIYRGVRKEAGDMLQRLEDASNAKSTFLSNMSHEIRTPMSAIIGMTGIAKSTDDPHKRLDCIEKIGKASKHLLGILNQILDISKIEAGRFTLDSHTVRFTNIVNEVVSVLGVGAEEKQLALEINVDERIPPYIVTDDVRLAQVLTNLLTNAIKFTSEGGKISLTAAPSDDDESTLRVVVADTGIGIPKDRQAFLFDDFMQVESDAARRFPGTGLGLAISKRIIEMMGGSIGVDSMPNEGARFIFTIPLHAGKAADVNTPAISDETAPGCFRGTTILVAEDVEINCEIVHAMLTPTEIDIVFANDGAQAVQLFRDTPERFALIFMDLQMPIMDGITATRHIRALPIKKAKNVPIIAMTANVFREDIEKCLEAGMNGHLGKPLDAEQIMALLCTYL